MKIALVNNQVVIAEPGDLYGRLKAYMKWNKSRHRLEAPVSLELLQVLSTLFNLPPRIAAEYQLLQDRLGRIEREKNNDNPVPLMKIPVKANLYKHQIRGINCALIAMQIEHSGYGFLFDMGLGKTLTTIGTIGAMYKQGKIKKVLVVAPSSVCAVWPKDLETFADFTYFAAVLIGDKKKRLKELDAVNSRIWTDELRILIINYESVWRDEIFKGINKFDPDLIICDESQRIKTHNAAQSKALHKLGDKARYKIILSGTPIQNNCLDFYSQYRFLDSSVFGKNFYAYRNRYCQMGGYQNHQIVAYKDQENLIKKAHSIAYRVTKEEALDLPGQTFEKRYVSFSNKDRKLYDELRRNSIAELESGIITAQTVITKLLRLQQLTGGFIRSDNDDIPRQVNKSKLDALKDILEDYVLEGCGKVVIFARFTPEVKAIEKLCSTLKLKYASISGEIPIEARGGIVKEFQENPETKIFIAQLQCAGLGITLTAANLAVYYSLNFNYADYSQSLARIYRIGQTKPCHYIHLLVENSVDDECLKALEKKEGIANELVNNWRKFFG